MFRNVDSERLLELVTRGAFFLLAPYGIWWTVQFSSRGLGFATGDPLMQQFGMYVAWTVFAFELFFNRKLSGKVNLTLMIAALFCYAYSISTTFVGLMGTTDMSVMSANWLSTAIKGLFSIGLDVMPEPMLVYAIFGPKAIENSDPVRKVIDLFNGSYSAPRSSQPSRQKTSQRQANTNRQHNQNRHQTDYQPTMYQTEQKSHKQTLVDGKVDELRRQLNDRR